jgi:hypothetical protein
VTSSSQQGISSNQAETPVPPAPVGTLTSESPDDVVLNFNGESNSVTGSMGLRVRNAGVAGGADIGFGDPEFGGTSEFTDDQNFFATATKDSIRVYTDAGQEAPLHSGDARLDSATTEDGPLCDGCSFIRWGKRQSHLVFGDGDEGNANVFASGWWVAGDIIDVSDLPFDGTATYQGTAIAEVGNNLNGEGWITYTAKGDMAMNWDFGTRSGDLTISNFDKGHIDGGLTVSGQMTTPGELEGKNKFSGELSGQNLPDNLSDLSGSARGSFVSGPDNVRDGPRSKPQGVIGNWEVGSERYKAGGIFGGSIK